ncbi:MAG: hypothetical protein A2V78_15420 [Betaproteobacteria bacterium RBG_16_64_18]|nr:MAG: hypothetical protein A2V78_15420 [Betaproteobacteria bacterium RBG_16_64_18]
MEPLSLRFIGWFYTLVPAAGLATGGLILYMLYRSGGLARRYAEESVLNDLTLIGIWAAGLLGGIGVLQGKAWALWVLEFFCWVLCVLVLLSGTYRLLALHRAEGETPRKWVAAVAGVVVVALPILAFCGATIYTLRSDAARQALTG